MYMYMYMYMYIHTPYDSCMYTDTYIEERYIYN